MTLILGHIMLLVRVSPNGDALMRFHPTFRYIKCHFMFRLSGMAAFCLDRQSMPIRPARIVQLPALPPFSGGCNLKLNERRAVEGGQAKAAQGVNIAITLHFTFRVCEREQAVFDCAMGKMDCAMPFSPLQRVEQYL